MIPSSSDELVRAPAKEILRSVHECAVPLDTTRGFTLYFETRNQLNRTGFGGRGVRSDAIPALYKEALDWTLDFLRGLRMTPRGRTRRNVYIFDLDEAEDLEASAPQMMWDPLIPLTGRFAILLPSQTNLPSLQAEDCYMRAAAAHECTHIVCFEQQGFEGIPVGTGWAWFSEGMAEWVALKYAMATNMATNAAAKTGSFQSMEFLADWFAHPGIPIAHLDERNSLAWYASVALVLYLECRDSAKAIVNLWKSGSMAAGDDPWPKIRANWGNRIFAEFCCDAYFMGDPGNRFYSPEIYQRFGPRAWEFGYVYTTGGWVEGFVHDFGCRYYAVKPAPNATILTVGLKSATTAVRANLLFADADYREVATSVSLPMGIFSAPLPALARLHHVVLMVTTESGSSHSRIHQFSFTIG
jgi:hypothetical protein